MPFSEDIYKLAKDNSNFRKVLYTSKYSQLVLMSIPPQGEIGEEVHPATDQIFYFVGGEGEAILDGVTSQVAEKQVVFVPANTKHNFVNSGQVDLKLFTIYAPPAHRDGVVHATKQQAEADETDHPY